MSDVAVRWDDARAVTWSIRRGELGLWKIQMRWGKGRRRFRKPQGQTELSSHVGEASSSLFQMGGHSLRNSWRDKLALGEISEASVGEFARLSAPSSVSVLFRSWNFEAS